MKKTLNFLLCSVIILLILTQVVRAENIHFNDYIYYLYLNGITQSELIIENDYFKKDESENYWTSRLNVYSYTNDSSPIDMAKKLDKEISKTENLLLLKFIQNKKRNVAVISYLENVIQHNQTFFIYNIYKYEKQPKKGLVALKYSKKYVFNNKEEIKHIANEIKQINDDYIERVIITDIPDIIKP